MPHSDVVREFLFTDHGIDLLPEPDSNVPVSR
jgi:hypothetical protein